VSASAAASEVAAELYFEDLPQGTVLESGERELSLDDMHAYNALTRSTGTVHTDVATAEQFGFKERLVPGPFVLAATLPLHGQVAEHHIIALLGFENVRFRGPVYPGDRVRLVSEVKGARHTSKPDRGLITYLDRAVNQRGETVIETTRLVLYERREKGGQADSGGA
jgi:acyl dehydratase